MKRILIVAARRTPFGRMAGALAAVSPLDMALAATRAVLSEVPAGAIDQVVLGQVFSAGHGMNLARQVAVHAGVPLTALAYTVNMMCGSGMHAAALGAQAIRAGEARAVLVGGVESMSLAPFAMSRPPKGESLNPAAAVDTLQHDGLLDSFSQRHMGETAETLARDYQLTRSKQDAFALRSQRLCAAALSEGRFRDELIPLGTLKQDEPPRPDVTSESLAGLKPVFDSQGSVTAGNASGLTNGAAMLVLAEEQYAREQGWPLLAEWQDSITVGCDPQRMGLGPVHAIRELFRRRNLRWTDIDALEINEAFAAQALACLRELELEIDLSGGFSQQVRQGEAKLNFNAEGGAIAIGHPLAASGARLLTHLAWKIARRESRNAMGALCIGGGMGIAASLSSVSD